LKPSVLVDTNILVSGLVFAKGNEHGVLKLAEEEEIALILPELVLEEARRVLASKFRGYEGLLDVFLSRVEYRRVGWTEIEEAIPTAVRIVRDRKDAAVAASVIVSKPRFFITGDERLREDLAARREAKATETLSSRAFLKSRKP
jgi:putative PIN family toxin of toxin-antitoxin system